MSMSTTASVQEIRDAIRTALADGELDVTTFRETVYRALGSRTLPHSTFTRVVREMRTEGVIEPIGGGVGYRLPRPATIKPASATTTTAGRLRLLADWCEQRGIRSASSALVRQDRLYVDLYAPDTPITTITDLGDAVDNPTVALTRYAGNVHVSLRGTIAGQAAQITVVATNQWAAMLRANYPLGEDHDDTTTTVANLRRVVEEPTAAPRSSADDITGGA